MATIQITEDMVLAKERENAEKAKELQKRSTEVNSDLGPEPNFPPECCCIKPMIYHNIKLQVPKPQQRFMYILAGLYLSLLVLILYNIVAALVNFILGGSATMFGFSFLYLLGIPGAWITWYYNIYVAVTAASRPRQVLGLFGLFIGFAFDAWMAVGVAFGACGWIAAIRAISKVPNFVLLLVSAILWTLHGVALFIMFIRFWRVSGKLLKGGAYIYRENII